MSWPFSKKKKVINVRKKFDPSDDREDFEDEDDPLLSLVQRIEIVVKDSQIRLKDFGADATKLIAEIPTIVELKAEIKALKIELKEANDRNWELINKLVDKPAAPSAAALYQANKLAENKTGTTTNSTAGPKGKLP